MTIATPKTVTARKATKPAGTTATKPARKPAAGEQKQATGIEALEASRARLAGGDATGKAGEGTSGKTAAAPNSKPVKKEPAQQQPAAKARKKQGASTAAPKALTRQVLLQEMEVPGRGGRNVQPELYPFRSMPFAEMRDGKIVGKSFFIPESEHPAQVVASGRKRHRGLPVKFFTRRTSEVVEGQEELGEQKGLRVWKVTPEMVKLKTA